MGASRSDIQAGGAYVRLYVRDDAFTKGLKRAKRNVENFASTLIGVGSSMAGVGASILAPLLKVADMAGDAAEQMSKFETVFGSNTDAVKKWGDEYAAQVGRSKNDMVDFLSRAQDTFVPLGFDPTEAEAFSKQLTTLAVDLASFNNMSDGEAFEKLLSSMVGNTENLRSFGVVAQDAQIKAQALAMGFDTSSLSAYEKAQVIMKLAVQGTAAAQGDAARTADSYANTKKRLTSAVKDAAISIGESLTPAITSVMGVMNSAVEKTAAFLKINSDMVLPIGASAAALASAGLAIVGVGVAVKITAVGLGIMATVTGTLAGLSPLLTAAFAITKISIMALAATMAVATGTATGQTAAFAIMAAMHASYPAVAGVVIGAMGLIGTALTTNITLAGLSTAAAATMGAAWSTAAAAASAAWLAATGPMIPVVLAIGAAMVAAGAAVAVFTAAIGGLAVAAGGSAAMMINFAEAGSNIAASLAGAMAVIKQLGQVMQMAFTQNDYGAMAKAAWATIKIAFWEGAEAALQSLKWLFAEGIKFMQNWGSEMVRMAKKIAAMLVEAIKHPFSASKIIGDAMADMFPSDLSITFNTNADAARAELQELAKALEEVNQQKLAEKVKSGAMTQQQADEEAKKLSGGGLPPAATAKNGTDGFNDRSESLKEEIIALRDGESALDRYRMQQAGLTEEQIRSVEALKAQRDAIEARNDAMKTTAERRVNNIAELGDQLIKRGLSPEEVQRREVKQIGADEQAGRLDAGTARAARLDAEQRMMDRERQLQDEGRRMAEEVRSPQEILNEKLRKISSMQDGGFINSNTATKQEDAARKQFVEARDNLERLKEDDNKAAYVNTNSSRPSFVTSSAAGLIAAGQGGNQQPMIGKMSESIKIQQDTKELTKQLINELRKKGSGGILIT